ncbi:hypothetical protein B0H34DRAFT_544357 [Crassisporium funariophilum]|nr:hypothetical protein B0H34DRAFT_544357 [Crassisporium funariophilum]
MPSSPEIYVEDDTAAEGEGDSLISPLFDFRRKSLYVAGAMQKQQQQVVAPKRSAPQMRLHLSIPIAPSAAPDSSTPQSDSPETPASANSPIAGVVDLTNHVKTISSCAMAQGGLSDIYKGEWYRIDTNNEGHKIEVVVPVAIKLLRILTRKDQDGVRARKV